jgi:hypothetical protein
MLKKCGAELFGSSRPLSESLRILLMPTPILRKAVD